MVGLLLFAAPMRTAIAGDLASGQSVVQQAIAGSIDDSLGRPIAAARVKLTTTAGRVEKSTATGPDGKFVLDVAPGSYQLTIDKDGFKSTTTAVVVANGTPAQSIALTMEANKPLTLQVLAPRFQSALNDLSPETGSSAYRFDHESIERMPAGQDTNLAQVLQQAPGVSQDSYGQGQEQVHVHGENGGGIQYRVNDIFLPDAVTSYGEIFSPRFVHSITLLTGVLPAEFGYRNEGVIDIRTKDGCIDRGADSNNFELYGGDNNTIEPSFELGGCSGKLSYYVSGFYLRDDLGLQPPTASSSPNHDHTDQGQYFSNVSYLIDSQTRLSLLTGGAVNFFQVPPEPGLSPNFMLSGAQNRPSSDVAESELEQNYFGVLALQGALGERGTYQVAAFSRYYALNYSPDPTLDLIYNGVAGKILQSGFINGLQGDSSYKLDEHHTLGGGFYVSGETIESDDHAQIFAVNPVTGAVSTTPESIVDDNHQIAWLLGFYLQDEWRPIPKLTINFGARWDWMEAFVAQNQFSPRLGAEYQLFEATVLHAGYARYFKVPPFDEVALRTVQSFANTTNAAPVNSGNDRIEAETDDYFDAGIRQRILEHLNVGLDGFYKFGHHQLDLSQLGSEVVTAPLNYRRSRAYGSDFSLAYQDSKLTAYLNFSYAVLQAQYISAGAFLADDANEIGYIANHYITLDDLQTYVASAGVSYKLYGFLLTMDGLWGSGYRRGFANTGVLPPILQFNAGIVRSVPIPAFGEVEARLAVINVFNHPYEIRNGTGIGVFSPSYGPRRAIYGGIKVPLTRQPNP
jgi:outer membrane receptor protein involved in Fe transport